MIAISISLLALAAGVYLLTYIKQFSLGSLYKYLAWLVILLSIGSISGEVAKGAMHMRHMRECTASGECNMKGGACPYTKNADCKMHGEGGMEKSCCKKDGAESKMDCCKGMADDSTAKK
jgi:hypothetical protein